MGLDEVVCSPYLVCSQHPVVICSFVQAMDFCVDFQCFHLTVLALSQSQWGAVKTFTLVWWTTCLSFKAAQIHPPLLNLSCLLWLCLLPTPPPTPTPPPAAASKHFSLCLTCSKCSMSVFEVGVLNLGRSALFTKLLFGHCIPWVHLSTLGIRTNSTWYFLVPRAKCFQDLD
jgi:hypothetical protein